MSPRGVSAAVASLPTLTPDEVLAEKRGRPKQEGPLLSPESLAAEWDMSPKTIVDYAAQGKIPAFKIGKHWRFSRRQIDAWLRAKCQVTTVEAAIRAVWGGE